MDELSNLCLGNLDLRCWTLAHHVGPKHGEHLCRDPDPHKINHSIETRIIAIQGPSPCAKTCRQPEMDSCTKEFPA